MDKKTKNLKPNIVIIGASGHAKVVIDIIEHQNIYNIVGLIDTFKKKGEKLFEYAILGTENELQSLIRELNIVGGIIAIGDNWTRKTMYKTIKSIIPQFNFITAIHPKSVIGRNVTIGKGTVVMPGVLINSDSKIGKFCILNTKSSLDHDSVMSSFSSLAPNVCVGGNVNIGSFSAICLGANILQDITIGKHTIIGAGALVNRNIENYKMAYGVPARTIKSISKGEKYLYHREHIIKLDDELFIPGAFKVLTTRTDWNTLLEKFDEYDFYHTYDYHMISKNSDETPIIIQYIENETIIALPLLLRNIAGTNYKDATSVYGYPGPLSKGLSEGFNNNTFGRLLLEYLKDNNIITIFSRLNPFISSQAKVLKNIGTITNQGKVVNIDLKLDTDIQRQRYQSRLKTHINKSRRCCSAKLGTTKRDLQEFMEIYYENMDRVNAKKSYYFSEEYFEKMISSKDFNSVLLMAVENETGKTIAASQFIITNNIVQYHLSGTKKDFLHLMPTKLLIDEMRLLASERGLTYFNLGGGLGGRDDDSLFDFKSSFSKDFKDFNLWKFIVDQVTYDKLVSKKGVDTASDFFPLYRSLDDLNVKL